MLATPSNGPAGMLAAGSQWREVSFMAVNVRIPQPLRHLTGNLSTVPGGGASLIACIDHLEVSFPGIRERMLDESGEMRRFVNVYVNGEDVRFMDGLQTAIKDGDELSIVPAVAGGS